MVLVPVLGFAIRKSHHQVKLTFACLSFQALSLADTACRLVADSFSVNACTEQNNSRRYAAVYSLITAYLENPVQDYRASAKQVSVVLLCVYISTHQ